MSDVIIYADSFGRVSLVRSSIKKTAGDIAARVVPAGVPYWIVSESALPDQEFFDAWELDPDTLGPADGVGGAGV